MTDTLRANRSWCAVIQWPGLERMLFGTVFTARSEGDEEARQQIDAKLRACFPTMPAVLAVRQGAIFFVEEASHV